MEEDLVGSRRIGTNLGFMIRLGWQRSSRSRTIEVTKAFLKLYPPPENRRIQTQSWDYEETFWITFIIVFDIIMEKLDVINE